MRRRFRLSDRFVEEHQLLGRRLQAIGPQYDSPEPDPASETSRKQLLQHRLKIGFPAGAVRHGMLRRLFCLVAVPDGERETPAHPPLLSEQPADSLQ